MPVHIIFLVESSQQPPETSATMTLCFRGKPGFRDGGQMPSPPVETEHREDLDLTSPHWTEHICPAFTADLNGNRGEKEPKAWRGSSLWGTG